jgi:hypothetical protein
LQLHGYATQRNAEAQQQWIVGICPTAVYRPYVADAKAQSH